MRPCRPPSLERRRASFSAEWWPNVWRRATSTADPLLAAAEGARVPPAQPEWFPGRGAARRGIRTDVGRSVPVPYRGRQIAPVHAASGGGSPPPATCCPPPTGRVGGASPDISPSAPCSRASQGHALALSSRSREVRRGTIGATSGPASYRETWWGDTAPALRAAATACACETLGSNVRERGRRRRREGTGTRTWRGGREAAAAARRTRGSRTPARSYPAHPRLLRSWR